MKIIRPVLQLLMAAAVAGGCAGAFAQADYPNRPVKIIVPFAAGGPADIYARFIAQRLTTELKQPFVVDDRPGAGSIIGTDAVAKAPADGYTLLMMSNTHTVNESLVPTKPFKLMDDFVGIAPVNYSDLMLVVHPSVPAKTLPELIALARSKPGKLNYASSGTGTPVPHGRRAVQVHGRRQDHAHPLQGQFRRAHRRGGRPGGHDVRRRDHHGVDGQGRQGARPRHQRQDPQRHHARPAHRGRGRRARSTKPPSGSA